MGTFYMGSRSKKSIKDGLRSIRSHETTTTRFRIQNGYFLILERDPRKSIYGGLRPIRSHETTANGFRIVIAYFLIFLVSIHDLDPSTKIRNAPHSRSSTTLRNFIYDSSIFFHFSHPRIFLRVVYVPLEVMRPPPIDSASKMCTFWSDRSRSMISIHNQKNCILVFFDPLRPKGGQNVIFLIF